MKKPLVIIVTYNAMSWVERCLGSLEKSSIVPDIFVVDNGSLDGTQNYIKKNYPYVKFVQSGENLGFGKANNLGFQYAIENGYDYVYLLNQDAWVDSNVIERLVYLMEKYSDYGIISPIQISADKKHLDSNFHYNVIRADRCHGYIEDLVLGELKDIYELFVVMAAHWMVRVNCLKKIGMFSEAFPHYGEDLNLIMRMHYHKMKVGLCPSVFGVHDRYERPVTSEKKIHVIYIKTLSAFHDIYNDSSLHRLKTFLNSFWGIVTIHEVSILLKLKYLYMLIRVTFTAGKYRRKYKIIVE
jgi:GT2 family glycosyltransferase